MEDDTNGSVESKAHVVIEKTEQAAKKALTVLWSDLPLWLQDNVYIQRGYRPASNSYRKSATSIFHIHNETVNIWTHLVGSIVAASVGLATCSSIRTRFHLATDEDVLVLACFFLCAFTCLGMSATYHAISNHSEPVARLGNRLDYLGIIFLIWGSFVPSIYYGFSAEPRLIHTYWSMVSGMPTPTY